MLGRVLTIGRCTHPTEVVEYFSEEGVVWLEPADDEAGGYVARRLPITVPTLRPNPDVASPKVGVGLLAWSPAGRFLVTRNDNMPHAVWVWDGETLLLHSLLVHQSHVCAAAWHPTRQLLAIATGGSKVYMWSPEGCRTVRALRTHSPRLASRPRAFACACRA